MKPFEEVVEHTLYDFVQNSPLKTICDNVGPDKYVNFSPYLVNEILRMSTPYHGVAFALKTVFDRMRALCSEVATELAQRFEYGVKFKARRSITMKCERLPLPQVTIEEIEEDETGVLFPLKVRQIMLYDRLHKELEQYSEAKQTECNVLTVFLDENTHLYSVLLPYKAIEYKLSAPNDQHVKTYEQLEFANKKLTLQLQSYERLIDEAKGHRDNALTSVARLNLEVNARVVAGQDEAFLKLRQQCDAAQLELSKNRVSASRVEQLEGTLKSLQAKLKVEREKNKQLLGGGKMTTSTTITSKNLPYPYPVPLGATATTTTTRNGSGGTTSYINIYDEDVIPSLKKRKLV
jgi:hypothetical protein